MRLPAALSAAICGLFVALFARATVVGGVTGVTVKSGESVTRTADTNALGWRTAFAAVALFSLLPLFQTTAILMTIDMPYCACWAAAIYFAWRALKERSTGAWLALGAAIGLGFLFKYTILLLIPGIIAAALFTPRNLSRHALPAALCGIALALAGLIPPILWNAQHDWATVRHLLGHLGLQGGDVAPTQGVKGWSYNPRWTLDFLGTQLGLVGPALLLMLAGLKTHKPPVTSSRPHLFTSSSLTPSATRPLTHSRFALLLAAPILLFYLVVSFLAEPEGNWAMAGYLSLLAPAALFLVRGLDDWHARLRAWRALPTPRPKAGVLTRRPETFTQVAWHLTLAYGLIAGLGVLRADLLDRALAAAGASDNARRIVPVGRMMGADLQAAHVARLLAQRSSEHDAPPFILAQHYGRASQLAFYFPGRPRDVVYCSSAFMGGRKTQYDIWPETNLANPQTLAGLRGRDAVVIGATQGEWQAAFERVEPIGSLEGDRKKGRPAFLAYRFKGWPTASP